MCLWTCSPKEMAQIHLSVLGRVLSASQRSSTRLSSPCVKWVFFNSLPPLLNDTNQDPIDMSVEGVFRKNGNIRRLKDLADAIDRGADNIEMVSEGPVQIAALLKKFLRELPDPLLTFKLHRLFVTSSSECPCELPSLPLLTCLCRDRGR